MLTDEQIKFLEDHKHYWTEYKQSQVIKHYDNAMRKKLQEIAKEFNPKAVFCTWCNDDAANMLKYVYTQYEKMKPLNLNMENKEDPEFLNKEEGVRKMTFPVNERPTSDTNQGMEDNSQIAFTKKRGRKPKNQTDERIK